jgi:hypothetical protein
VGSETYKNQRTLIQGQGGFARHCILAHSGANISSFGMFDVLQVDNL